jgi:hypothetical protein
MVKKLLLVQHRHPMPVLMVSLGSNHVYRTSVSCVPHTDGKGMARSIGKQYSGVPVALTARDALSVFRCAV